MIKAAFLIAAVGLVSTLLLPANASAGGEPRTHDGFMLRLSVGGGTGKTEIDDDVFGSVELSGAPYDINFAIGGMVSPNFALHGTLFGWSMSDPDADVFDPIFGSASGTLSGDVTLGAFGGGVTYYIMPVNIYLSGSLGLGSLEFDGEVSGETDMGMVFDLTIGKEWWVGNSWGLGVAGAYGYHSLGDPDVDASWSGSTFTVRFSATMN